jgi:hypothetical protein
MAVDGGRNSCCGEGVSPWLCDVRREARARYRPALGIPTVRLHSYDVHVRGISRRSDIFLDRSDLI